MSKLIVIIGVLLLLSGCGGVTTRVDGCNNTINIFFEREGGSTIDAKPNVEWGNVITP